jgi:hypothetical protein
MNLDPISEKGWGFLFHLDDGIGRGLKKEHLIKDIKECL